MKVLVLGANGQLGSDLLRANEQDGCREEMVPFCRGNLDVSKVEALRPTLASVPFDVLINCTSYHRTDELEGRANEAFAINAHAVRELAAASQEKGARFIHISTDYVFSGNSAKPYTERDSPGPLNVYGASKLMGESLAFAQYPGQTIVLRVASLFGVAGSSGKGGNFVETMIRLGKEKGVLKVVNDITMSPTSTASVARFILKLLAERAPAGLYHAVNSGQASWFEFAREIIRQAKVRAEVIPVTSAEYPTVAARPAFSVLDNSKLAAAVGRIPSWQEALGPYLRDRGHLG
jgi:dTDP-4-dehydrorhamnose reductase